MELYIYSMPREISGGVYFTRIVYLRLQIWTANHIQKFYKDAIDFPCPNLMLL